MVTSKFGAIYTENLNGEFELYDIVLVDYDMDTNEFIMRTGPFKNLEGRLLNLITTNPNEFFKVPNEVFFKDYDEEKDHIILFENDYIDEVTKYNNFDDENDTFAFLGNKLAEIAIHKNKDGSFYTKKCDNKMNYSKSQIDIMFYSEDNNEKEMALNDNQINDITEENLPSSFDNELEAAEFALSSLFGMKPSSIIAISPKNFQPNKEEDLYKDLLNDLEKIKRKFDEERKEKLMKEDTDTKKIISDTSKKIVGQEEVIKTLVNQIYNNQMIINSLEKDGEIDITELDARKTSILLDGETGTGKTAILKDIAKQLGLPIVIASSTNFSATGYIGASVTDLLEDLLNQAKGDLSIAERGIIVFDEIDKISFIKDNVIGKDMREEVQHELLTFIGGGEYDVSIGGFPFGQKIKFDTSKVTFILSGAFTDLREDKIKEIDKNHKSMGFSTISSSDYEKEYVVTPDDYIKYGLMREFFGRIKVLTSTKSYNLEDCKRILLESSISPLLNLEKTVKMYGYPGIKYDEEFLNRVSEEGMKMKTGARGLQTVISGIQNNMLDGLINKEYDKDKEIELTTKMIDDYKKLFVRKF